MPFRSWDLRIQDILQAIHRIQGSTSHLTFEAFTRIDELILQGILYNFLIIGEASVNVPNEIKSRSPQIPWCLMADMRNVMAHEYFQVNQQLLWNTIQNHLPPLIPLLEEVLERESQGG